MQLFLPYHYAAFEHPKPTSDDPIIVAERLQVRTALLKLDDMLWPHISASGWDLHRHRQSAHYVSSDHFIFLDDGTPVVNHIDAMWLHYGKSPDQLDFLKTIGGFDWNRIDNEDYFNAFYLHSRIQFFLNDRVFRSWLLIATDKNYYDRSEFLRNIYRHAKYRSAFYGLLLPLFDKGFFFEIDSVRLPLASGLTEHQLIAFVKKDHGGIYSGIVKEYQPNDPLLDSESIGVEMIKNMELFYPIYDFVAWRP